MFGITFEQIRLADGYPIYILLKLDVHAGVVGGDQPTRDQNI